MRSDSGVVERAVAPKNNSGSIVPFDAAVVRSDLTKIFQEHGSQASDARPAVARYLTELVDRVRSVAEAQLLRTGDGLACAAALSKFQDDLIQSIFDFTVANVYRPTMPGTMEPICVIATGGYGRGLLAPGSDIDLLFLLPSKQTPWGESVVEYILYLLWDLRFKVGHATRTIDQCLKMAQADMTIRTALLDARYIFGDRQLFDDLQERFQSNVVRGTERQFIDAKFEERTSRHKRTGESRYKVEPNIKDGKGGLRDLNTLQWLVRYMHGEALGGYGSSSSVLTASEHATFRASERFLWTVRCHLHFMTKRAEERLTFDLQPLLAERLHYRDRGAMRGVERFMKHYFLVAKDVGDLTGAVSSALEVQQFKSSPSIASIFNPTSWRVRRRVRTKTEFRIDNGRLNISDPDVFKRDPVNLIRYFRVLEETQAFSHPEALRKIRSSIKLIDDRVRKDPEANRIFIELLTKTTNPEGVLRRMNEAGVLGKFIPAFGKVVSMMQYNMYHHYTVDEHLVRTVGEMAAIEQGKDAASLPLSVKLIKTIQNRRVLFVAAFLHDIAKGQDGDHSILGAEVARKLCPRLGLDASETDTVAWLIEEHLTMSNTAQSRDLSDPKTIRAFADTVQSIERLKLLTLLTVADTRAVGPNTWNGWKGQLLRTLYFETEQRLTGGHGHGARSDRVTTAQDEFRAAFAGSNDVDADAFIARAYPDYWLKTDTRKQIEHARLLAAAELSGLRLATEVKPDAFTAVTEFTVLAPNHPRLLAMFAGACAAAGANIVGAHISTTRDGMAIDSFLLQRAFEFDDDEMRRGKRISDMIEKLLKGESWPQRILPSAKAERGAREQFAVPSDVVIDNSLSDQFTVIEASGLDRTGLLYDLTSTLSDLSLDITSAHITTFGEKAVDVFYVTDLTNKKVTSAARQKAIRDRLIAVLDGDSGTATEHRN